MLEVASGGFAEGVGEGGLVGVAEAGQGEVEDARDDQAVAAGGAQAGGGAGGLGAQGLQVPGRLGRGGEEDPGGGLAGQGGQGHLLRRQGGRGQDRRDGSGGSAPRSPGGFPPGA